MGLAVIKDNLGTSRTQLSPGDMAKLDLFMALYGIFDPTQDTEISSAITKIQHINWFAQQLEEALASDALDITIFCNDDHLDEIGPALDENGNRQLDEEGREEYIYQSSAMPLMMDIAMAGKCDENEGLRAFMQNSVTDYRGRCDMDVLTICPICWGEEGWLEHFTDYATKNVEEILSEALDDIVSISAEANIIHEIAHTVSFFTDAHVMEDNKQTNGADAYKWEGCYDLAQNQATQDFAITNAGKLKAQVLTY
ncbi:hypothetical protein FE257_002199 [Aspergillus nanangensis]|uniref:Lysine-specific metallo-endopeptidase domain-containing protein n=1 Tax=Aspergillus nanangensis TaxID=2582783 RepID=A0AAD4CE87_ASPNN|nr:hypothetical protein FE257_002199 [Aspergillus nanangensis]